MSVLSFDPTLLQQDLKQIPDDLWTAHFNTRDYEGDWFGVALRGPAGAVHPIQALYSDPMANEWSNTPILNECEYFQQVLKAFACPLQSVRLLKLGAGAVIKEHRDHALGIEDGMARLHVPVQTNPDVEFVLNERRVIMNEGECWYLNFNLPHRVNNRGQTDRIHLVMDCVVNEWLNTLLQESMQDGTIANLSSLAN